MVQLTVVATNLWPYDVLVQTDGLVWRGKYLRIVLEIRNQNSTSSKISIINTAAITFYTCVSSSSLSLPSWKLASVSLSNCVLDPRVTLGSWLAQVHTYPVGTWNSSESASKCFATHKNGTHLDCVLDRHVTLGHWLAQVHTYPVGTWNSSESAPKCFATHKNGTHLHWYTPTLWVHGTAQSLPQSALQLTRMAPIFTGQLVHTYPVGTWNSSESASKCFATHKNGTHLDWYTPTLWVHGIAQSLPQSALQLTRMAPIFTGQLVHTYPVGTWNSSESAPKCFATHKNGTHLHWYTPTLWVHGTAQSLPQSALQLTRMAPISIGQLVHTYPVGTWNSSESAPKCFATHKNGTHLHWSACTHLPCGYMEQLRVCLKVLCNSQEWHPSPLKVQMSSGHTPSVPEPRVTLGPGWHSVLDPRVTLGPWLAQVHTYPVGTWNSSESAPKCFATHKNGTHLHWYTPTLWVHGTAQSLPQSALQLTRMAPIFTGQLVHTYPVGTWNSSESASKCFATHKNGTHLDWYTPTLWVHGIAQSLPQSALQLTRMAPISIGQLVHTYPVGTWNSSESAPKCFATHKNGTHLHCVLDPRVTLGPWLAQVHTYPVGTWNSSESASKCFATHKNGTHLDWYTPTLWVHGTAQSLPQSALQLTRMAPIFTGQLVHTYPVGTWNSSESAPKCFATHKNGTHLHCVLDPRVTLGPWLEQVHTYPVGTWNSSESASKCFATHKNGTHLDWYTPTLWVHGTAQSLPQSALQLTRMAPISIGQLVHTYPVGTWNSSESAPKCFATHKNGTHLDCVPNPHVTLGPWLAQVHTYPVGTWNSSESAPKCFATHKNGTHLHWYTPTLWVHGTAQSVPQSALQLTRMAPISIGQLVHTYPVGTWNSSESASKCFATHKNGTHLDWSACTHLPFGYMEQLRVCLKVLCNSQEWHPSPLVSLYTPTLWVHGTAQSLSQSALQLTRMAPIFTGQLVHTYPVGTWNSSESAPKCFATHKNGTHLHWSACTHLPCGYMEQLRVCPKVLCNSQEWHPSPLVSFALDPRVTLGPWLAQVHTYPVGTWNSSESAPKCFATHKNGTHLHWYTPTLWVHGTAQSLPQSALQLTRMAPIFTGQLVHTYPVGTWNSSESASKCFATHKNGTHLDWYTPTLWVHGIAQSLPQSALQLTRMAPISIGQLVHTYPVGTWNSSESASKCFATHKNGTHLHWYTPTLWVHGTAQSLPQSALQLTRMAPIFTGQLVHTYPVGTWNSSECASKCFATHKNGTHLDWYTPTLWVHGTAQSLPQSALQLTRMAPISIGQLVHTYPVGTWNSSESAPKCFATHKNGTHLHCVPNPRVTLGPWLAQVHTYPVGTWNSSESAPKCFATHKNGTHLHCVLDPRMTLGPWLAQVHTYPVGTWNSSESASKCFATHKNGTHLDWYTPTLWVHGIAQSLPQSALQLTRMAPISIGQLVHTYPVGTWNSSESAPKCFATHKNGTHLHCVLDPRVTLGPWLAQVHTYPVGTWNSSESASKCFATHKNGTHLDWYTPTLWVHGTAQSLPQSALQLTRMAPIFTGQLVHTYPVGTWNSSESAPKCFATHKNGTHLHCVLDPRVTLGPWLEQVHTYPVGTWNSSESASKCFATHKNGTHLDWYTPTLWVHGTAQSLPQSALQLTRMAPISIGQLVHTYPVGTWNSSESAPKCFATHKNGTHLDCVPNPHVTLGPWLAQVHTYPVGTWNSSESAPKCFATHKNGTHLHWYTPTLWVHGTAQSVPQSALQLTRMAPISIGQLVHTYPVGTWNSSESASKCFATHKNGTHLDWSACTHLPFGYMEQLRVCLKVLCNSQEWHPSRLVSLYTPTLWVHGTAQSLPQSALQLTRMAPISIGQLVHTYPVGTWNSSESVPKCFATHKNGTHLHWYTPTLWVHGIAQSLPQSALQLTRMAPIFTGQLVHTYPVGTWNSSESAPKCFATHKNGTHLHCALDPRVTLGPWLAQVHTYPVGTWNSSESAPKCFATHKNGTHLHCVLDPRVTLGPWLAQVHTYPVGTWNSSESASKCFATHKNGTHLHCVLDPCVTLGPWLAQLVQCSGSARGLESLVSTGSTLLPCGYI
eukprot:Em0042g12a